jgi:predicted nuclease with RNAse H fold
MTRPVFIGIDPTAGRRPLSYAVLDDRLRLVEKGSARLADVLAAVSHYPEAVVAVDAPYGPNRGLMAQPEYRRRYGLSPDGKTWTNCKVCEYELRRRNIRLYLTPGEAQAAPTWMRLGFDLYAALQAEGFQTYAPDLDAPRRLFEVHPHACYAALLGHLPLKKDTLEGRLQRQIVLYDEGLGVPDPMDSVEEITRHHLREGTLTFPGLFTHDELDALVAAYTAYLAVLRPARVTPVGDPAESQIVLPVAPAELKDFYR